VRSADAPAWPRVLPWDEAAAVGRALREQWAAAPGMPAPAEDRRALFLTVARETGAICARCGWDLTERRAVGLCRDGARLPAVRQSRRGVLMAGDGAVAGLWVPPVAASVRSPPVLLPPLLGGRLAPGAQRRAPGPAAGELNGYHRNS
jgi:hypothetical protein